MNRNTGIITICKQCKYCNPIKWSDPSSYYCDQSTRTSTDFVTGLELKESILCRDVNTDGHCPNYRVE